ncbi:PhzF family phenazine biosynthesis protein [Longispora fulva]|uniref:PhzF family phenazine biosynthesis protein n=1 Tax=Longispora fulva TaxID=619741 RepID=UPI001F298646|nr:PhzF family phenazine biosynthesis isomerase [Longispora fulva]
MTIIDACRRQGRGGSPTAVLDDAPFTDAERRRIPAATGTSHAVFIAAGDGDDRARPSYRLRFFTSEGELPACGHGTVAALALLALRHGGADYRAVLHTTGRVFEGWARRERDGLMATFDPGPIRLRDAGESELRAIVTALGLTGEALADGACVASPGRPRLLLPVRSRTVLAELRPDFATLRQACDRYGLLGCYAYSGPEADGQASARMFAPSIGVPEDVANANSTACLAACLAAQGVTSIAVDMGDHLGRPSTITASTHSSASGTLIRLGGAAQFARAVRLPQRG